MSARERAEAIQWYEFLGCSCGFGGSGGSVQRFLRGVQGRVGLGCFVSHAIGGRA